MERMAKFALSDTSIMEGISQVSTRILGEKTSGNRSSRYNLKGLTMEWKPVCMRQVFTLAGGTRERSGGARVHTHNYTPHLSVCKAREV